jgi:hypothetical protein
MRADPKNYALAANTAVQISGGIYMLIAAGTTGQFQLLAPDGTTWEPLQPVGTSAAMTGIAGCISPIYLPAGQVKLASGTGWLVGIG